MKIVLLENLGVSAQRIEQEKNKLNALNHEFYAYEKTTDLDVLLEETKDADVIMLANMPLDAKIIENNPNLKLIDVAFTGVDHIPTQLAKEKGIAISNASGYANDSVAELAIMMMIDCIREVTPLSKRAREGQTKAGIRGRLLKGKTVGIVGAGEIGTATARLCKAFGCKVIGYRRSPITDPIYDKQCTFEELLQTSDIVSLHVPLNENTKHMISSQQLAMMKKDAILINTARGAVVDNQALAKALNEGQIGAAGIDVFDVEPPLSLDEPLLHSKNTIVTPHIGFDSVESMELRADIVFDNLYSWLNGEQKNKIA